MPDLETSSLSEHESTFQPRRGAAPAVAETEPPQREVETPGPGLDDTAREAAMQDEADARDPMGRFKRREAELKGEPPQRHRAKSQQATADDVPTIQALTKDLRGLEAELAKVRPGSASDSPRLVALRRQIRGVQAELDEAKPKPVMATPEPLREAAKSDTKFEETEPDQDALIAEGLSKGVKDPYLYASRLIAAYDRRKDEFERGQQSSAAQTVAQQKATIEREMTAYRTGATEFAKTTPDFEQVVGSMGVVPEVLGKALVTLDNGWKVAYKLASRPDVLAELVLLTDGKPLSDASVASVQRLLTSRLSAERTAAATAPRIDPRVPKPPTAVRTGPLKTGDEEPDDSAPLSAHEAHFNRRRR